MGFNATGFSAAMLPDHVSERLNEFIEAGYHGDMAWLGEQERAHKRAQPQHLWPEVKSVISLGVNYGPEHNPLNELSAHDRGNISVYARHKDYHDVIKKKLRILAEWIAKEFDTSVKIFVDTAPIMEKPLAQQAGLGWQGKHTNLVSREFGSWLFLAEIFTSMEFAPSDIVTDHCGNCRRCLDICPTNAFVGPYKIDARRCISYLTIEHKSHIPIEFRKKMGNRIYGCDDCLSVCPWNKFAQTTQIDEFKPKPEHVLPMLAELLELDDSAFRARYSGSPIKRIGRDRFIRNVLIAVGNSGERALIPAIIQKIADISPLVRAMAIWALGQLAPDQAKDLAPSALSIESDPDICHEWQQILEN